MTDKEFLLDILETEKNMAVNMTYALNEASNDHLYKELLKMFNQISQNARDLFTLAYELNFYNLEAAAPAQVQKTAQTLTQQLNK